MSRDAKSVSLLTAHTGKSYGSNCHPFPTSISDYHLPSMSDGVLSDTSSCMLDDEGCNFESTTCCRLCGLVISVHAGQLQLIISVDWAGDDLRPSMSHHFTLQSSIFQSQLCQIS